MTHPNKPLTGGHVADLDPGDRTESSHQEAPTGITLPGLVGLVLALLLGRRVGQGRLLVTPSDALAADIPEVGQETVLGHQGGKESPAVLVHQVAPGTEMEGTLVVVPGLVINTLENPAPTVVTESETVGRTEDLTHALVHALVIGGGTIAPDHVPGRDSVKHPHHTSTICRAGVGNRLILCGNVLMLS